jgi:hypothetical protein
VPSPGSNLCWHPPQPINDVTIDGDAAPHSSTDAFQAPVPLKGTSSFLTGLMLRRNQQSVCEAQIVGHVLLFAGKRGLCKIDPISLMIGCTSQDLRIFQMLPIPILSVLIYSTSSPHDISKVSKKINHNLLVGQVKGDVVILVGLQIRIKWVFDLD